VLVGTLFSKMVVGRILLIYLGAGSNCSTGNDCSDVLDCIGGVCG
jgi:hypothetical protein